jgi:serine phosphatase RsbU (regulator of sigma subunit)
MVLPDGDVRPVEVRGLALGVEPGQRYLETRAQLPPGAGVVLYTDGVVEARRNGEFYGAERLDELVAAHAKLSAAELARAVLDDCRSFAGGDLSDDCAVVVIKRVSA